MYIDVNSYLRDHRDPLNVVFATETIIFTYEYKYNGRLG